MKPIVAKKFYDVVVAGGGMIGLAFAACLAKSQRLSDIKILILESSERRDIKISKEQKYSNRVLSINPASAGLLDHIGVWNDICGIRAKPVKRLQIWDSCSEAMISFNNANVDENMSYIVENDLIIGTLNDKIENSYSNQIQIEYGVDISRYNFVDDSDPREAKISRLPSVELSDGTIIEASLLIGADGITSKLRQAMGCQYLNWIYDQKAIIANLKLSEVSENTVAWQRFLPNGPLALLPLTDDMCSLVWSTSIPEAKALMQMSKEEFIDALNHSLWDNKDQLPIAKPCLQLWDSIIDMVIPTSFKSSSFCQLPPSIVDMVDDSRACFPLGFGQSTHYVRKRVALIGDAAHRIHPMAGLGVNLGFGDVKCLTDEIASSLYDGSPLGDMATLLKYESQRQNHNLVVSLSIEFLHRLYNNRWPIAVVLRSMGLSGFNTILPLKKFAIERASSF